MGRQLTFRLGILCGFALLAYSPVRAQQLVGPQVDPAAHGINTARERSESSRFRYAHINAKALNRSTISLNLFPGVSVNAIEHGRGRQFRAETWTGRVEDDPLSSVVLALDDSGVLFGKVEFEGRTFLIRPKAGRVHAILEVSDPAGYDEGVDDAVPLPDAGLDAQLGKLSAASICLPSSTCANKTIDIMVVYTGLARIALGGSDASAQAAIAAAVAEMNAANSNSGVTHTFNLVHSANIYYLETGNSSTDLTRLSGNFDGYMDEVHSWRTTYGADLVSLITDTGGCGIGYIQSNPSALSSSAAFSVVRDDCLTTNRSLAHEMGHNMGLHHDWYVNSNSTPCQWVHGYVNQAAFGGTSSQRWRTVMAYNDQCSAQGGFNCSRIGYWSNPSVLRDGDPMGLAQGQSNPSDAAFTLNRAACQVADFQASTSTPQPPLDPSGLVATGVSTSVIDVSWTDNATNETGYMVQRSADGVSGWSDIATLGVNANAYSDGELSGEAEYYYRTYAFHATDQSEYSNVDSASTMAAYVDYLVSGETVRYGISSGALAGTHANDGVAESLQEEETAGWEQSRTSRLDVTWQFDVVAGASATFLVNAWSPVSTDGDLLRLSYSTDNASYSPMFFLSEGSDTNLYQEFDLGVTTGSSNWIRLEDTDRGRGNRSLDQVFVDHMCIRTQASSDAPPPAIEAPSIHLADLQASVSGKSRWTSTMTATVHNGVDHTPSAGATVSAIWNEGKSDSCVTDASGTCAMSKSWKPKEKSVTFMLTSISKPEADYDPGSNDASTVVTVRSPDGLAKSDFGGDIPEQLTLRQNYPNPFNPTTVLEFSLPEAEVVRVSVFNTLGREVRRLMDGAVDAGWHSVTLDASDLSSGVYFAIIQSADVTQSRTMLLTR